MTLEELIRALSPEVYRNLRQAVELGRWPDGRRLTPEQRELCMEAVLHYESVHQVAEQDRVGFIDRSKSSASACSSDSDHQHDDDATAPVKWMN